MTLHPARRIEALNLLYLPVKRYLTKPTNRPYTPYLHSKVFGHVNKVVINTFFEVYSSDMDAEKEIEALKKRLQELEDRVNGELDPIKLEERIGAIETRLFNLDKGGPEWMGRGIGQG